MAMSRVSMCDGSRVHILSSTPFVVQVAAVFIDQLPHWWVCELGLLPSSQAAKTNRAARVTANAIIFAGAGVFMVVSLFVVMWADSSHRKKAVGEIRVIFFYK